MAAGNFSLDSNGLANGPIIEHLKQQHGMPVSSVSVHRKGYLIEGCSPT